MPVVLDTPRAHPGTSFGQAGVIEIALLNNLGDKGLIAAEQQFVKLLSEAAGPEPVHLRVFTLPNIARGPEVSAHIATRYTDFCELMQSRVDGLIVTGCEPRAARLPQEPLWPVLTEVIDWAEHKTTSTIFSCLAAHAAVLHLDGVDRRPLTRKCCGLFAVDRVEFHSLLAGVDGPLVVPHSRWNGLDEAELRAAGYSILTRSPEAGVDLFVKQWRSLFVYLQGHPEYDEDALRREYRRDVFRFVDGSCQTYPSLPKHYFSKNTEAVLRRHRRAKNGKSGVFPHALPPLQLMCEAARPRAFGIDLLCAWLKLLRNAKSSRLN